MTLHLSKADRISVAKAKAVRRRMRTSSYRRYRSALDAFVAGLKADGVWESLRSAYVFMGPTQPGTQLK